MLRFFVKGEYMRKFLYVIAAVVSLGITAVHAQPGQKAELDDRVRSLNSLADRRGDFRIALHNVSVETGVPMDQLQRMHDQHPDAGPGGIMVACVLADDTKKSPEHFLASHAQGGHSWASIARENNVPLDRLNGRLDRLQDSLQSQPTGRDRSREYRDYNNGYRR
jgi:hypothetical protein